MALSSFTPTEGFVADPYMDLEAYDPAADLLTLNLGPQHPSTHGVFRILLHLDGETIIKAVPYPGYLHRGVEKLCEKLAYVQITPIVDKNDYVSPMNNEQAVCMAFEKMLKVEVPARAQYLRTIVSELTRIQSHLLWLGTFCIDLGGALGGGSSIFLYCFRERELILGLFEALTGCRFHYNTHTIGGNRHDIPEGWARKVRLTVDHIEGRISEYETLLDHPILLKRTQGVGTLDGELAMELGITGPNLRASGVDFDLRRDSPYHIYDQLNVNVAVERGGDCYARYRVRVREMQESIRLVKELIDNVPQGPLSGYKPVRVPGQAKVKAGTRAYACIETPRGELGTYVVGGGNNKGACPYRLKIRPPSLHAVSCLPYILPTHNMSDAIAILGSLDPIMGEVDR